MNDDAPSAASCQTEARLSSKVKSHYCSDMQITDSLSWGIISHSSASYRLLAAYFMAACMFQQDNLCIICRAAFSK